MRAAHVLQQVHHWFFGSYPIHGLIVSRVLLGVALALAYLQRADELGMLFQVDSVAWLGAYRDHWATLPSLPLTTLVDTMRQWNDTALSLTIGGLLWLLIVASFSFALGFWTKTSGVIALLLHSWFSTLNPIAYWGWSVMITPFLLYVLFTPCGRFVSLDGRRSPMPAERWVTVAWPVRLLQVHVCMMYAEAGFSRLDSATWSRGEMLFQALTDTTVTRFAMDWSPFQPVLQGLSYVVWILEPAAVALLWFRPTRKWIAIALIGMHLGLELLSRVGMWNFAMIAALVPFLPIPWIRRLFSSWPALVTNDE